MRTAALPSLNQQLLEEQKKLEKQREEKKRAKERASRSRDFTDEQLNRLSDRQLDILYKMETEGLESLHNNELEALEKINLRFNPQLRSEQDQALRMGARGAKNLAAAVAGIADIPFDLAELARYGSEMGGRKTATTPTSAPVLRYGDEWIVPEERPRDIPPPQYGKWSQEFGRRAADAIDELTEGYTESQTPSEHKSDVLSRALLSIPAARGVHAVSKGAQAAQLPSAIQKIGKYGENFFAPMGEFSARNVGGTGGGAIAAQNYLDTTDDPSVVGALGSGLAGSVAGGSSAHVVRHPAQTAKRIKERSANKLAARMAKLAKLDSKKLEEWNKLGIDPTVGMVSERAWPFQSEVALGKSTAGGPVIAQRHGEITSQLGRGLGVPEGHFYDIAQMPDMEVAKRGAQNLREKKSAQYRKLTKELDEESAHLLDSDLREIDIHSPLERLRKELFPGVSQETFEDSPVGEVFKKILAHKKPAHTPSVKKGKKSVREKEKYPEEGFLDFLREEFGDEDVSVHHRLPLGDVREKANLALKKYLAEEEGSPYKYKFKRLYEELRDAGDNYLEGKISPPALEKLAKAREAWKYFAAEQDVRPGHGGSGLQKHMYDILGSSTHKDAFRSVLKSAEKMDILQQGLNRPEQIRAAQDILIQSSKENGAFNLNRAQGWWSNLDPTARKNYLSLRFGKDSQAQENFTKTMRFMYDNKTLMQKLGNSSGTAHVAEHWTSLKKAGAGAAAFIGGMATGNLPVAAKAAAGLALYFGGQYGGAKLLTDPIFLRRMAAVAQAKTSTAVGNRIKSLVNYQPMAHALRAAAKHSPSVSKEEKAEWE